MNEYQDKNRIAKIYPRTFGGYRVWLYDVFTEFQDEKYYNNSINNNISLKPVNTNNNIA